MCTWNAVMDENSVIFNIQCNICIQMSRNKGSHIGSVDSASRLNHVVLVLFEFCINLLKIRSSL